MITQLTAEQYHADPCDKPSLSASIATVICNQTPLHAWERHPKLNPFWVPTFSDPTDKGTIAHALLLKGESVAEVLDFPDFRTKAAREARDAARDAGKVPILTDKWGAIQEMVLAIRRQLKDHRDAKDAFTGGQSEVTIAWVEDGIHMRCMIDYLHDSLLMIDDLKTTGISASPDVFLRSMFTYGLDIQAAMYRKAVKAETGEDAKFRFIVCEGDKPYALSVIRPESSIIAIGEKKIKYAKEVWARCLESGVWPGYPAVTHGVDLPEWEEQKWLAKEERYALRA